MSHPPDEELLQSNVPVTAFYPRTCPGAVSVVTHWVFKEHWHGCCLERVIVQQGMLGCESALVGSWAKCEETFNSRCFRSSGLGDLGSVLDPGKAYFDSVVTFKN